ncbi:MAG: hypothetical protein FJZ38_20605 [Candidatus Rokubacteria bacterium]|nr:hypothetical protein [Candidatus Rokubacteria bacterium]
MFGFILGALVGGVAAWWWRNDIQRYVDQTLPNVRTKTADQLSSLEQRAEDALHRAKGQIDRIRPEDQHGRMRSTGSS